MISKEILKKHNLKAVPFSCIREGETFHHESSISSSHESFAFYERRLAGGVVDWADGTIGPHSTYYYPEYTVYVPVWRVTK